MLKEEYMLDKFIKLTEDIFEGASDEEVSRRKLEWKEIKLKEALEDIKSRSKLNVDGALDIRGDVDLCGLGLTEIPLKFGIVGGRFDCSGNYLTSLKNCPSVVGGSFNCYVNYLTSLEGCPMSVGGAFDCCDNKVKFTEKDVKEHCYVTGYIYT